MRMCAAVLLFVKAFMTVVLLCDLPRQGFFI